MIAKVSSGHSSIKRLKCSIESWSILLLKVAQAGDASVVLQAAK